MDWTVIVFGVLVLLLLWNIDTNITKVANEVHRLRNDLKKGQEKDDDDSTLWDVPSVDEE